MSSSLLDETTTWAEFGRKHLDQRVAKALTVTLGLDRPTLVQSRGIPVALQGKDLLCRARTGSGKTLCYGVPLVQRLLREAEAQGSAPLMGGLILVPTKELIVQVQGVISSLLSFCFDVLTVEPLLAGQKFMKAELPTVLVTTPSSLLALLQQRKATMPPLAEVLKVLVVDEADLMFSFGYEGDMRSLCALLPSTYQAMLVSATLSEEVEQLKGLMLHKPVVLRLEEPRVTGKLSQFYYMCQKGDKYLILYTLLKLQLVQGKILMFVKSVDAAYRMKIFLERFSINSAVLNAELPHATRQNIIQAFNQSLVELLIATDAGFRDNSMADDGGDAVVNEQDEASEDDEAEDKPIKRKLKKKLKKKSGGVEAEEPAETAPECRKKKKRKTGGDEGEADTAVAQAAGDDSDDAEPAEMPKARKAPVEQQRRFGQGKKRENDEQFSLTRGVDLKDVSTVINTDMPTTVRDYVHRVGRCARGGASGTALTLCTEDEEPMLKRVMDSQSSKGEGSVLKSLPMQMSDAERFRYRVEDMARGLSKKVVAQYLARELQLEALNSEKLKAYFEDHPEDKRALQKTQRQLRERKSVRQHLRHVPSYLVPDQFTKVTPVQQAVREEMAASGGGGKSSSVTKHRRAQIAKTKDPLQGFGAGVGGRVSGKAKKNAMFTREVMQAKERRIDPKTANVEDLPPISGRKLWKLRHSKTVRKKTDSLGERKRQTPGQKRRTKKFGF